MSVPRISFPCFFSSCASIPVPQPISIMVLQFGSIFSTELCASFSFSEPRCSFEFQILLWCFDFVLMFFMNDIYFY